MKILENSGLDYEVVDYIKTPPSAEELKSLAVKMGIEARNFIRSKESIFKALGLEAHMNNDTILFTHMAENPQLIERPIVVKGERAVLGRPPEKTEEFLKS